MSSSTLAARGNAASTLTYLRAERTLWREYAAGLPAATAAAKAYVQQVITECPDAAGHAPVNVRYDAEGHNALFEESEDAIGVAFAHAYTKAGLAFVREVQHLSWSSRKLTRLVHAEAATDRAELTAAPPRLCSDLREWAAGGYGSPPHSTKSFLRREEENSHGATREDYPETRRARINALLASYAVGDAKALLRSDRQLETRLVLTVLRAFTQPLGELQKGLGLSSQPYPPTG